jgi:arsenate reductase (thioredoxin)
MSKAKVLFLCTRNSVRSQMAEAFLKKYAGDKFDVYSAGLEPGEINPYTKKVMEEIGFDLSDHHSKGLKEFMGKMHIGYLITVCSNAEEKCPFFPGIAKRLHWPFDDPASFEGTGEEKLAKFREIRDQIKEKIQSWLEEIKNES